MLNGTATLVGFGLFAAISWGFSDFLAARAARSNGGIIAAYLVNLIGVVVYVVIFGLLLHPAFHLTLQAMWEAAVAGIIIALGALAFFKGLEIGPVSLVSPLSSTYPLVITVLALLLFHANLSARQLVAIGLVLVGVLLASEIKIARQPLSGKGPMFGILAAIGWGIGYALVAQAVQRIGWETATLVEMVSLAIMFSLVMPFLLRGQPTSVQLLASTAHNKYILGAGIVQLVGVLAFNYGFGIDSSSGAIISAISACYPVLTIFLALRHFHERVAWMPLSGAVLSIIGIALLSLG